jgi:pimeloyl-ACP methyl ester carboxylesterase
MNKLQRFWHQGLGRPLVLSTTIWKGQGETVVLLHGIASSKDIWDPLLAQLRPTDKNIVAMDLLGYGKSPKPDWSKYSTQEQATAVLATLKKRHIRGRITIVGHSMGALVAVHIATVRPRLVKRLILYEPPIFADLEDYPAHLKRRNLYFRIFERLAANPSGGMTLAKALGRLTYNWGSFLKSEESWLPIERGLRNSIMQQSVYRELHDIGVPTAIVHGRLDIVVTRAELKKMYKDNSNIMFYMTTANHGMNNVSARFLARMIAPELKQDDTKKRKSRRPHESTMERPSNRRSTKRRSDIH